MSEELKPCPCCGGEAILESLLIEAVIRCKSCGLKVVKPRGRYEDKGVPEAIAAWNRRAEAQQGQHDEEAIELSKRLRSVPAECSLAEIRRAGELLEDLQPAQQEPVAYLVEGKHDGMVIAHQIYFDADEAKRVAAVFAQHYPTVNTKPLYTTPPAQQGVAKDAALEAAANICDALAKLYPRQDIGFDKGYSMGTERAAKEIRALKSTAMAQEGKV